MQDVTAPKLAKVEQRHAQEQESEKTAVQIDQLPLADAIKTIKGNGTRKMVVFSDPACGYCKRLEPELDKLDNVTIHTFLVPFQGEAKPIAIWCASDRQLAWRQIMRQNDASILNASANCPHPINRNLALAQRLKVRGTPTMFFADGRRIDGYTDAADIEARLSAPSHQADSASTVSTKEKS
jgi:thiol:disulfide interchange protein DsbC